VKSTFIISFAVAGTLPLLPGSEHLNFFKRTIAQFGGTEMGRYRADKEGE